MSSSLVVTTAEPAGLRSENSKDVPVDPRHSESERDSSNNNARTTEPGDEASSERILNALEVDDAATSVGKKRVFSGAWHEVAFIAVVMMAQLVTQMNLGNTIVQVRSVARGLGVGDDAAQESCITVGAFVLVTGRLGDIYGIKVLWLIGWIWLSLFSLLCGFCDFFDSDVVFDIFRALGGIGPAMLMPNASALLASAFKPGFKKNLAFAIFGAVAPGGYVAGLAWGGIFTQLVGDWRWTYWSMSILCLGSGVIAHLVIPNALNIAHGGSFDYLGSAVGVSGLVLIFFAFNAAPLFGWSAAYIPILLAIGLVLIVLFVIIENRVPQPVMPMSMFTKPAFAAVMLSLSCGWMSFGMFQYYAPQFLLRLRGITMMELCLQFIPLVVDGALAAALAVYLLPRVPAWVVFISSMIAFFTGQILLALMPVDQEYWPMTFPLVVLIAFGPDLSFASASLIVSDQVPKDQQGAAGSFVNTVVNYSIGLGLAFAGNLEVRTNDGGKDILQGYRSAWWLGTGFAGLGVLVTFAFRNKMQRHKIE
ncbi:MFS-type transporter [Lasiodiplodia theobromae]|uniref:MFS-type transporter n=1 Tax=Lasiodiplodia theobromae TaxID=45133 RepID=UPI0015C3243D|nr:MFS-type transporter [Lasiodiplodia theobromae]KAF4544545.1 MFS-type transporter [Lasiodiplodia theobromae]